MYWKGKMAFETDLYGHTLRMDALEANGGDDSGTRPKVLLLAGLAGCTGMDVVSLLAKMRVEVDDFRIQVQADSQNDYPKYYKEIRVVYWFKGTDLPMDKLEKVVQMSYDKYCSVMGLFKLAIPVVTEIRVEPS